MIFKIEDKNLDIKVTYHKIAEEYPKPKLNEKQRETFKKFFKIDIMLYERFNRTLHEKIAAFGHERYFLFKKFGFQSRVYFTFGF